MMSKRPVRSVAPFSDSEYVSVLTEALSAKVSPRLVARSATDWTVRWPLARAHCPKGDCRRNWEVVFMAGVGELWILYIDDV